MYTESNVKLSCNALWQKCVLATLYRAAATHPEIKLLQFKLIPGWICPYISRHLLSLNPLQARCRRYSRGER
ncbi:hypothetical protein FCY22_24670 [Escherichia coli]|nr:hypothetical protein [Escherichia coli]